VNRREILWRAPPLPGNGWYAAVAQLPGRTS
jgi:hypothetical protein